MTAWNGERWHAATAELERCLELGAEAREARLTELRQRDPALAADVGRLLENQRAAQAAGFLEGHAAAPYATTGSPAAAGVVGPSRSAPAALRPGDAFGPYRILRILGRGGMGIVYEAEEADSGRRIALKVLQERLSDERERERFDREGRLAASIDHEHCVFVFGAAEIGGVPSIAMELMQSTLADRVASDGPMPPALAVDAALQLISGLDAASAAGILHRDVKPSNCFVDADGVVKIGDFGISRSTRPTQETALSTRGQLAATPTYASPEQLRGAALDVRADIYSLGATLYDLLTGVRPFTGSDLMALLMAVANDTPKAPHAIVPAIPAGLSRVVLRCMAKRPEDRYGTYDALAAALEPYASIAPTPATLGRRLLAGILDSLAVGSLALPAVLTVVSPGMTLTPQPLVAPYTALGLLLTLLYYGGSESLWAATPGKALFGLTVVDAAGRPPRAVACLYRAAAFAAAHAVHTLVPQLVWRPNLVAIAPDTSALLALVQLASQLLMLAALFSTARRRNGYAALHDLATGTRIVERSTRVRLARHAAAVTPVPGPGAAIGARGPFAVLEGAIEGMPGWRPGFDSRLRRGVWIRDLEPGTAPLSPQRARLARPTRLRWLAGRRTADEAWDVYEEAVGVPLARACATPRRWADVCRWLLDLAHELAAQAPDDRPPRSTDRVWILASGRAKLLDDPTVDTPDVRASAAAASGLLRDVVRLARSDAAEPWPTSAERLVARLDAPDEAIASVATELEALAVRPAVAARSRRSLSIATQMALPALVAVMTVGGALFLMMQMQRLSPEDRFVMNALQTLVRAERSRQTLAPDDRRALEIVLASRHRRALADGHLFNPASMLPLNARHKTMADAILERHGLETRSDGAENRPAVRELIDGARDVEFTPLPLLGLLAVVGGLTVVAYGALVTAVATRGSVLRLLGFEVVKADGTPASRGRVLARTAIAWSPIVIPGLVSTARGGLAEGPVGLAIWLVVMLAVMLAGAIAAIRSPSRGIQDRLARTWLVPR